LEGVDVAEEEGIPEQVASFLSSILPPGEEAFYFAQADIDEEGKFGERWLFITKEKIDVLNPVTKHVSQFPLSSVSSSTVRDYLGNAELIIETKEGSEGIIRFSRVHLDEFHNAARLIDKIAKQ
jgi:ATP-binding cassette subfamily B protein